MDAIWPHAVAALLGGLALLASAHAVLTKRNARSVIGWVGLIWLAPLVGSLLYALLGVNRIRRRARALRGLRTRGKASLPEEGQARLVGALTGLPLEAGNRVTPLFDAGEAHPAMLEAIEGASRSLALSTYIFDAGGIGRRFVEALARAVRRGVEVRVLIDDVGARYSWPSIVGELEKEGVRVARFLPLFLPLRLPYFNLRIHRKILVADGRIGFTGGINIREGPRDLHCRLEGPVVAQLQRVFAEDWRFASGEVLEGEAWFPALEPVGGVRARAIPDGPDDDEDVLRLSILGALATARRSVRIATPYFLPDESLVGALGVAALRGVEVDILLPAANNLRLVQWASAAMLWQVLKPGCRVWLSPPPFDHGKMLVVDGAWSLLGSGNWDPRSFRLNFELDVELYDAALAERLEAAFEEKRKASRPLPLAEADGRSLPVRLRDGLARLLTPYL